MPLYELDDENEWADVDDLVPEKPGIPEHLMSLLVTSDETELDDLGVYEDHDDKPIFYYTGAVEATPEEMTAWKAESDRLTEAQEAFRKALEDARKSYEAAVDHAILALHKENEKYRPTFRAVRQRRDETAAMVLRHKEAAEQAEAEQWAKRQAEIDAVHGPACIAIAEPKYLASPNKANHICKVHLTGCKYTKSGRLPLRAHEAWEWLKNPVTQHGHRLGMDRELERMKVKFCNVCKPWTAFEAQIPDFRAQVAQQIKITEWPDAWKQVSVAHDDEDGEESDDDDWF